MTGFRSRCHVKHANTAVYQGLHSVLFLHPDFVLGWSNILKEAFVEECGVRARGVYVHRRS